jgi:hypothetical protein
MLLLVCLSPRALPTHANSDGLQNWTLRAPPAKCSAHGRAAAAHVAAAEVSSALIVVVVVVALLLLVVVVAVVMVMVVTVGPKQRLSQAGAARPAPSTTR